MRPVWVICVQFGSACMCPVWACEPGLRVPGFRVPGFRVQGVICALFEPANAAERLDDSGLKLF